MIVLAFAVAALVVSVLAICQQVKIGRTLDELERHYRIKR